VKKITQICQLLFRSNTGRGHRLDGWPPEKIKCSSFSYGLYFDGWSFERKLQYKGHNEI